MPTDHEGEGTKVLRRAALACLVMSLCALPATRTVAGEPRVDYLLMGNVTATHYAGATPDPEDASTEWEPEMTFLYTADGARLRFFTELELQGNKIAGEIARLQAGWRLDSQTTLWVGRFHGPQGYWNSQFHHGVYFQTSISRPEIETFDDEGGVLPSHIIGLQLDGTRPVGGEGSVRFEVGAGVVGALTADGLEPPVILGPQRDTGPTVGMRVSYSPTAGEPTSFGLFLGRNRLPAQESTLPDIEQTVAGGFAVSEFSATRYIAALFYLRNRLSGAVTDRGQFANAYVQAERRVADAWTAYGRLELSSGTADDPYLALFPHFASRQGVVGLRWDIPHQQALKLEAARPRVGDKWINSLALEWSFVYP